MATPPSSMDTYIHSPDSSPASTIIDILESLRKLHLTPRHEAKAWGDWIYLDAYRTVISIDCNHGLCRSATVEHAEGEEDGEPAESILKAFARLGWLGRDEDGDYALLP